MSSADQYSPLVTIPSNCTIYFSKALLGDNLSLEHNVRVHVENGYIRKIDTGVEHENDDILFLDHFLIPCFINAHTHIGDTIGRGQALESSLDECVGPDGIKFNILREGKAELQSAMKAAINTMYGAGVGHFIDFREGGIPGITALQGALKGTSITCTILGRPAAIDDDLDTLLDNCDGIGLSSSSPYDKEFLIAIRKAAMKENKIVATHALEGTRDVVDLAYALENLMPDVLIHLTKAKTRDIQAVVERNTKGVVACPRSNAFYGLGSPPILEMQKMGLLVCLGTDNVMTTSPNILDEARWLAYYLLNEKNMIKPRRILEMISTTPSNLFNLSRGIIKDNMEAVFLSVDMTSPRTSYWSDPYQAVLFGVESLDISLVVPK